MGLSPASILYNSDGSSALKTTQDGSDWKLELLSKIRNAAGTIISPATETTVAAVETLLTAIKNTDGIKKIVDALPIGSNVIGKIILRNPSNTLDLGDDTNPLRIDPTGGTTQPISASLLPLPSGASTEATLNSVKIATESIKDTDGVKKITDPLPAGDNNIGNVDAIQSGDWTVQQGTPPWAVEGTDDDGAAPTKKPVLVAGQDGTNVQTLKTDTDGRSRVVGAASDGAAVAGDPVLIGGQDGTNAQSLLTDASGRPRIVGAGPDGSAVVGDPVLTAGIDGSGNAQTLKTNTAGRVEEILYDSAGNAVGVVLDGSVYRLQSDAKVAKGASDLVHLDVIDTVAGKGRLKATLYTAAGSAVSFPASSADLVNDFVKNGGSDDLLVDGDPTSVEFTYLADATDDIAVEEIHFTLVSTLLTFGAGNFGSDSGPLTNGVLVQVTHNNGTVTTLYNLVENESFVNFATPGGFQFINGTRDLISSLYAVEGALILKAGTSDKVSVTVRDDIDKAGNYFKCYVKGNSLSS